MENWISATPTQGSGNGSVNITVNENTTVNEREGSVTISGGATRTVNVNQKKALVLTLSVVPNMKDHGSVQINNGKYGKEVTKGCMYGEKVYINCVCDTGTEFIGWYNGNTLFSSEPFDSFIILGDTTLIARLQFQ